MQTRRKPFKSNTPTPQSLHQRLRYNPYTGALTWRNGPRKGKKAGYKNPKGYLLVRIEGELYLAHRVAWAMYYGEWPTKDIGHDNGKPWDNRIKNLEQVTPSENMKNRRMPKSNSSGVVGVGWSKDRNKWQAYIRVNGVQKNLGLFEKLEDAAAARKQAEIDLGFHQNHGKS